MIGDMSDSVSDTWRRTQSLPVEMVEGKSFLIGLNRAEREKRNSDCYDTADVGEMTDGLILQAETIETRRVINGGSVTPSFQSLATPKSPLSSQWSKASSTTRKGEAWQIPVGDFTSPSKASVRSTSTITQHHEPPFHYEGDLVSITPTPITPPETPTLTAPQFTLCAIEVDGKKLDGKEPTEEEVHFLHLYALEKASAGTELISLHGRSTRDSIMNDSGSESGTRATPLPSVPPKPYSQVQVIEDIPLINEENSHYENISPRPSYAQPEVQPEQIKSPQKKTPRPKAVEKSPRKLKKPSTTPRKVKIQNEVEIIPNPEPLDLSVLIENQVKVILKDALHIMQRSGTLDPLIGLNSNLEEEVRKEFTEKLERDIFEFAEAYTDGASNQKQPPNKEKALHSERKIAELRAKITNQAMEIHSLRERLTETEFKLEELDRDRIAAKTNAERAKAEAAELNKLARRCREELDKAKSERDRERERANSNGVIDLGELRQAQAEVCDLRQRVMDLTEYNKSMMDRERELHDMLEFKEQELIALRSTRRSSGSFDSARSPTRPRFAAHEEKERLTKELKAMKAREESKDEAINTLQEQLRTAMRNSMNNEIIIQQLQKGVVPGHVAKELEMLRRREQDRERELGELRSLLTGAVADIHPYHHEPAMDRQTSHYSPYKAEPLPLLNHYSDYGEKQINEPILLDSPSIRAMRTLSPPKSSSQYSGSEYGQQSSPRQEFDYGIRRKPLGDEISNSPSRTSYMPYPQFDSNMNSSITSPSKALRRSNSHSVLNSLNEGLIGSPRTRGIKPSVSSPSTKRSPIPKKSLMTGTDKPKRSIGF